MSHSEIRYTYRKEFIQLQLFVSRLPIQTLERLVSGIIVENQKGNLITWRNLITIKEDSNKN